MQINFWQKLKRPFFILAPMADVTDMAFRQIVVSCGKPDVFYTEFVSCDGLCSEIGRPKLMPHFKFQENERPIIAQFFGSRPENFYKCAQLAVKLGFDGIDINMGCPDRNVMKQGGGAALILKPELAKEIIKEIKRGAHSTSLGQAIPVSVKTRLGYNKIVTKEWISHLVEAEPAAIIIHGRTAKEMSKVSAHWDEIGKAASIAHGAGILAVGNGDVESYKDGVNKAEQYGLDGIMIGRGIFSNLWFFDPSIDPAAKIPKERTVLMKKHIELFTELWSNPSTGLGQVKNFDVMKKFFKVYISGWDGAKELRAELMKAKNTQQVDEILNKFAGTICANTS